MSTSVFPVVTNSTVTTEGILRRVYVEVLHTVRDGYAQRNYALDQCDNLHEVLYRLEQGARLMNVAVGGDGSTVIGLHQFRHMETTLLGILSEMVRSRICSKDHVRSIANGFVEHTQELGINSDLVEYTWYGKKRVLSNTMIGTEVRENPVSFHVTSPLAARLISGIDVDTWSDSGTWEDMLNMLVLIKSVNLNYATYSKNRDDNIHLKLHYIFSEVLDTGDDTVVDVLTACYVMMEHPAVRPENLVTVTLLPWVGKSMTSVGAALRVLNEAVRQEVLGQLDSAEMFEVLCREEDEFPAGVLISMVLTDSNIVLEEISVPHGIIKGAGAINRFSPSTDNPYTTVRRMYWQ